MLGFLFGFNARLGRLHFFLASLVLAVIMTVATLAMVWAGTHGNPEQIKQMATSMGWPFILLAIFFMWASLTLQAMRFRDIGWDPVCVVPLWIAGTIVDRVIAMKVPAWSLTASHSGTIVGALINLGLLVALLFFPSGEAPDDGHGGRIDIAPRPARHTTTAPSEARLARVSGGDFGRRTV